MGVRQITAQLEEGTRRLEALRIEFTSITAEATRVNGKSCIEIS